MLAVLAEALARNETRATKELRCRLGDARGRCPERAALSAREPLAQATSALSNNAHREIEGPRIMAARRLSAPASPAPVPRSASSVIDPQLLRRLSQQAEKAESGTVLVSPGQERASTSDAVARTTEPSAAAKAALSRMEVAIAKVTAATGAGARIDDGARSQAMSELEGAMSEAGEASVPGLSRAWRSWHALKQADSQQAWEVAMQKLSEAVRDAHIDDAAPPASAASSAEATAKAAERRGACEAAGDADLERVRVCAYAERRSPEEDDGEWLCVGTALSSCSRFYWVVLSRGVEGTAPFDDESVTLAVGEPLEEQAEAVNAAARCFHESTGLTVGEATGPPETRPNEWCSAG